MPNTDVIIIGAGQAGLAMSHCLAARGIEHVVLERGEIGQRWRAERWPSLRLLTPNWLNRLPGWNRGEANPDAFMAASAFADSLQAYARSFSAPVLPGTAVLCAERRLGRYCVATDGGTWRAPILVVATGACASPRIPACARSLPAGILQMSAQAYRAAERLPPGGVLIVGASSSGLQLAEQLHAAGRRTILAIGTHTRLPRRYRGQDIFRWLDRLGVLDETLSSRSDPGRALSQPSLQLVGSEVPRDLDLAVLQGRGIALRGRLTGIEGTMVRFAGDLATTTGDADRRMSRLLDRIDALIEGAGDTAELARRPASFTVGGEPVVLDLRAEGIGTILWATGFRASYPWLRVPVFDAGGEIEQLGGIAASPGLYVLGLRFMRHRNSSFIGGCGRDASALAAHVAAELRAEATAA